MNALLYYYSGKRQTSEFDIIILSEAIPETNFTSKECQGGVPASPVCCGSALLYSWWPSLGSGILLCTHSGSYTGQSVHYSAL